MAYIDLRQIPPTGLDFMNEDHRDGVEQLNSLEEPLARAATGDAAAVAEVDRLLDELLEHTREHFGREQAEMERCGFPAYPIHRGEHERVLAEMESVIAQWKEGRDADALERYLRDTYPAWFVQHVSTMDAATAHFVRLQGVRSEETEL